MLSFLLGILLLAPLSQENLRGGTIATFRQVPPEGPTRSVYVRGRVVDDDCRHHSAQVRQLVGDDDLLDGGPRTSVPREKL